MKISFKDLQFGIGQPPYSAKTRSDQSFIKLDRYTREALNGQREPFFLCQMHHRAGVSLFTNGETLLPKAFDLEGDFILTNSIGLPIGVFTADCVPILLYDPQKKVIGAVHAGWRGAVLGVIQEAVLAMMRDFGVDSASIQAFFGPAAQRCCYEVGKEVVEAVQSFSNSDSVLTYKGGQVWFDLPLFNRYQLESMGVLSESIHIEGPGQLCTIENKRYHSYRRDGVLAGRNVSLICL